MRWLLLVWLVVWAIAIYMTDGDRRWAGVIMALVVPAIVAALCYGPTPRLYSGR